jgi:class 3 adenylate cyclase/tetratricopeptide (TPR) repeat protein
MVRPQARFCDRCGGALTVHKTLTSKRTIEGERKQVTVLFADIKGSLELLADRDPEEVRKVLDPILELMMDAVHRYEGTVNQVMGDGIMALFGAPLAYEDHTVRACYAALLMQQSVDKYATEGYRGKDVPLQIRIGLNSGEVVVRSIESDLRMDYTAVGQTTHLAARMEQMAKPGTILIPIEALRLAEGNVEGKSLGYVDVKGLSYPIEVCEVTGVGWTRTRFQGAVVRGLTRFVGRDTEIETLHRVLQHTRDGQGQVLAVVGEAGVGKSRLFHEFVHSQRTKGCLVLWSSSVSYGKTRSYLPVVDLLKAYFHIEDHDDGRRIRDNVTEKLQTVDVGHQMILPACLELLAVPVEDAQWQALDPSQRRRCTLNALHALLLWESRRQPLLIAVENLHWIDSETQALLDCLVMSLSTARMLLLVNYRPEYQHNWGSKAYYRQLRMHPLAPESTEVFLQALLGADAALQALKRLLVEQTGGNPFFLEESVRTLIETHVLTGERGAYCLTKDVTAMQVAPTVQVVLAARIDRLPPEDKRLLQAAAVIGKDVPGALLQAISDESEDDVRQGLSRLQAADFLYATRWFPDLQYTFKHALTHDVAYGSLVQNVRRPLHARVVAALETLYPDRLAEHVERLAYHAFRAEMWGQAVTYLRRAGAKAFARSATRESVAYFEQALTALQHEPETRETLALAIDLRFDLRNSLLPLGKFDTFYVYLREAEALARRLDDQRRLGWVSVYMCHYLWMTGRATAARSFGQSAYAIASRIEDFAITVTSSFYLGLACFASGDYRQAGDFLSKVAHSLTGDLSRERCRLAGFPAAMSRSYLGLATSHCGAFTEGIADAQEGVRLAEDVDHPYSLIVACWSLGSLYSLKGDLDAAVQVLERGLTLCHEWQLTVLSPLISGPLGYVYVLSGRMTEGLSLLHSALDAMETIGRGAYHSLIIVYLGEAYVLANQLALALTLAERALRLTRERGERGHEALTQRLLGDIACMRHPRDATTAADHYHTALTMATKLSLRPLVARCHLGLGVLNQHLDKRRDAHEHLSAAITLFREMQMWFWLEKAEAEMRMLA